MNAEVELCGVAQDLATYATLSATLRTSLDAEFRDAYRTAYARGDELSKTAQLYHLYARKASGGRVRLTVWPMPKSACETMASKQSASTRPNVYILPARWDDVTIPDTEK